MFKLKRLSFIFVVLFVLALTSCQLFGSTTGTTGTTATTKSDADKVAEAKAALILGDTTNVKANLTLPTVGKNGTTITWSSNNTDVLSNTGVVTRPVNGSGNVHVTLTATITLNSASDTKDFDIKVIEDDPKTVGTIATIKSTAAMGSVVEVEGIVSAKQGNSIYMQDATAGVYIYTSAAQTDFVLGNQVKVTGTISNYNGLIEVSDVTKVVLVAANQTLPAPKEFDTIAALTAANPQSMLVTLKNVTVKSVASSFTSGGNIVVTDGTDDVTVRVDKSVSSLITPDIVSVGDLINVTAPLGNYNGLQIMLVDPAGVEKIVLTDAQKLQNVYDSLSIPNANFITSNISLPATINGVAITWESGDTTVVANDGTVTIPSSGNVTVTLTATLSIGTETPMTKDIQVTVLSMVPEDISVATTADEDANITVKGIVTGILGNSYFLQDATGGVYVYASSANADVAVGNELLINGTKSTYHGLVELSPLTIIKTNTAQTLPAPKAFATVDDLAAANVQGQLVTLQYMEVTAVGTPGTKPGYSVTVKDLNGDTVVLRVDNYLSPTIENTNFTVGEKLNVTAPLGWYDAPQVMLTSIDNINTDIMSITDTKAVTDKTKVVTTTGVVTSLIGNSAFIQDDATGVYVYSSKANAALAVGNKVVVSGKVSVYHVLIELTPVTVTVASTGNTLPAPQEFTSIATLKAADVQGELVLLKGVTVDSIVPPSSGKTGFTVKVTDGTDTYDIRIDNYVTPVISTTSFLIGQKIDVKGAVGAYDTPQLMLSLIGDVTYLPLTDAEKLDIAQTNLTLPAQTTENLVLPASLLDVAIAWESGDTTVIANDGTVTRPAAGSADVTVTMTATLSIGTETSVTKDIQVVVKAELPATPLTVAQTLAASDGTLINVQGIVATRTSKGFVLQDADGAAGIYVYQSAAPTVAIGDLVTVAGTKTSYKLVPQVATITNISAPVSTGNTPAAATAVTDLAAFRSTSTVAAFGKTYTFTNVTVTSFSTSYIYFYTDGATSASTMAIYLTELNGFTLPTVAVGDHITFTATLYASNNDYNTPGIWRFNVKAASDFAVVPA